MIDLLVADDARGFGLGAALAMEGVPARRIERASEFDGQVLIVTADRLDDAARALARRVPTVVIGAGADGLLQAVTDAPFSLSLDEPIWPDAVRRVARTHADGVLRLPQATGYLAPPDLAATVLATFQDAHGRRTPAVMQRGHQVWCLFDLGAALTDLLAESYLPEPTTRSLRSGVTRSALALYYRAPDAVRRVVQAGATAASSAACRGSVSAPAPTRSTRPAG